MQTDALVLTNFKAGAANTNQSPFGRGLWFSPIGACVVSGRPDTFLAKGGLGLYVGTQAGVTEADRGIR